MRNFLTIFCGSWQLSKFLHLQILPFSRNCHLGGYLFFFKLALKPANTAATKISSGFPPLADQEVNILNISATNGRIGSPLEVLIVARMRRKPCFLWLLVFVAAVFAGLHASLKKKDETPEVVTVPRKR